MRVACVICTDLFVSSGDISVTECGHLFHSHCIIQWLERSKTCPQCRCKTQEKKIIKIFIDCCESISEGFDSNELQNEVGNLRFKLSLKAVEAKKAHEEKEKLKEQTDGLREEVKKLEKQSRNRNDTVTALKMQLEYLSEMARDNKKLQEERDRMRIKLRLLTNVDAAVTQSTEEVTEMLTAYSSEDAHAIKHLVTYCVVLKKELSRTMEERRKYSDERHRLRANGQRLERRLQQLETQQTADDTERAALEEDNSRLTKQVKALEASVVSPSGDARNSALTRLLSENTTPVELRSRPVLTVPDTIDLATPELAASQLLDAQDFEPQVTASCDANTMTILVRTEKPFFGVIHGKDNRKEACTKFGDGSSETRMLVNLVAQEGDEDFCGVKGNNRTDERSIPIAVRFHKKLEVAEDKLYVITCGNPGFKNSRNEKSLVTLRLMDRGRRAKEVVYGRPYNLQVKISKPDDSYDVGVKNCFSFSTEESRVGLIDDQGCPERQGVISKFVYNKTTGTADAVISSMYRFPNTNQVNFQCDVIICKGVCPGAVCRGDDPKAAQARALVEVDENNNALLMASTSVFVVEPGETVSVEPLTDCDGYHPEWLLYLCIAFGLLFLIMMIINCFLCTAMTCSCTKTEVIEKDPSLEDYDPYRSWHGSQYSLNGKSNHGYDNYGASTMNSARSVSTTGSDHYAMVHSRPGSRYSEPRSHRSAPRPARSETGSQYRDTRTYNTAPRNY